MAEHSISIEAAERFARLEAQVAELDKKVALAHTRVDNVQLLLRDHVEKIHEGIAELTAFMNQMKGRRAALGILIVLGAGVVGSIASAIVNKLTGGQ